MCYLICKELGWDYFTYMSQPLSFIRNIWEHMAAEFKVRNEQQEEMERNRRGG